MTKVSSLTFGFLLGALLVFIPRIAFCEDEKHDNTHLTEGLMRGERLFFGLIEGKFDAKSCADCHNTIEIDTFNWNPSAWEIANQYKSKSIEEFSKAVLQPTGKTMSSMHQTFNLSDSDVEMIKLFLDDFEAHGLAVKKPVINKIFLFILLGIVLTWVVLDVFLLKKVRRKYILGIIFIAALGGQVNYSMRQVLHWVGRSSMSQISPLSSLTKFTPAKTRLIASTVTPQWDIRSQPDSRMQAYVGTVTPL